jgi:hypothetical protein
MYEPVGIKSNRRRESSRFHYCNARRLRIGSIPTAFRAIELNLTNQRASISPKVSMIAVARSDLRLSFLPSVAIARILRVNRAMDLKWAAGTTRGRIPTRPTVRPARDVQGTPEH